MAQNVNLHILETTKLLEPFKGHITDHFRRAVTKVEGYLPLKDVDIKVQNDAAQSLPGAVGGFTPNSHEVYISFNVNDPELPAILQREPEYTLIHELHHVARSQAGLDHLLETKGLLEALINEGLADHFAVQLTQKEPPFWVGTLSGEHIQQLLPRAEKEYFAEAHDHDAWFYGASDDIPRWAGYSLGWYLVGQYLQKHPGVKAGDLYKLKAEEFI